MIASPPSTRAAAAHERERWRPGTWKPLGPNDFPTLGWGILEHASATLPNPGDDALSWVFTDEQALRTLEWYRLDPDTGDRVYRRRRDEEAKGRGKSPEAAVGAIEEFSGPVCFDGWDAKGQPVGVPWGTGGRVRPWIWIAAVSEDQTGNTYNALFQLLTARMGKVAEELRIDVGQTRLHLMDMPGAILEPVTARAGSKEGTPITHAIADETQLWTPSSGGTRLMATIRRNLAKMGGTSRETCNAPMLGLKSVAESSDTNEPGVLHYAERPAVEPQPDWTDDQLLEVLTWVYRNSPWVGPRRILKEVRDPETEWGDALRFYFNIRSAGISKAVDPRRWAELKDPLGPVQGPNIDPDLQLEGRLPPPGTRIGAGFDGSISQDGTVLRGCTEDRYRFTIGTWVRPTGDELQVWLSEHPEEPRWRVIREEVNAAVDEMFETWDVGLFRPDSPYWWSETEAWVRQYGAERVKPINTFEARQFAPIVGRWMLANKEGTHTHDGDPVVTSHVLAARVQKVRLKDDDDDGRTRYLIVKGDDKRKIDGAIADALAVEAAATMPPPTPKPRPFVVFGRPRG